MIKRRKSVVNCIKRRISSQSYAGGEAKMLTD